MIEASDETTLSAFQFGTDGKGADTLLVTEGGARCPEDAHQPRHRKRWPSQLYMDGPSLITFAVEPVPKLVRDILTKAELNRDDVDLFILHQATYKMMEQLKKSLEVTDGRFPIDLENYGNTVSSTIPILIKDLRCAGKLRPGMHNMLVGFGVGWSWAGCMWNEVWEKHS